MTEQSAGREVPSAAEFNEQERQVWESLAVVTDPELDESVTALGFVSSVNVSGQTVKIVFHLPTYWCAANFAYMMAYDMRRAVNALSWVNTVTVELQEHMYSDTINRGIAANSSFQDTFGEEASDEIDVVRVTFRKKAFQQRQELLIRHLLANNHSREYIVNLRLSELDRLVIPDDEGQRLLKRYQEIRMEWGGANGPECRAFVKVDGQALSLDIFEMYLSELRSIRINTQFNGEICRGLLDARYGKDNKAVSAVPVKFPALEKTLVRSGQTAKEEMIKQ